MAPSHCSSNIYLTLARRKIAFSSSLAPDNFLKFSYPIFMFYKVLFEPFNM